MALLSLYIIDFWSHMGHSSELLLNGFGRAEDFTLAALLSFDILDSLIAFLHDFVSLKVGIVHCDLCVVDCTLSRLKDVARFEVKDLVRLQPLNERGVTTRGRGSAGALSIMHSLDECGGQGDTLVVLLAVRALSIAAFAGNVGVHELLHVSLILLLFIIVLMVAEVAGALLTVIDEYADPGISTLVNISDITVIMAGNYLHIFFFFVLLIRIFVFDSH